jgi:hypothetical protein
MALRSVKRQRYPCRGRSFLPTSEGGAPQTGWVAGCRSPRPISQRCAESKHTDGPHSPVRAVRASTAHKSASAFAPGFETMRVPTAADCRISRRQSAFMVGKSFTQLAALLFVEWRSKVRPSPSETSKRRPRAPRDRRRAPASVAFWRKDDRNSQLRPVVEEVPRRAVRSSGRHSPFLRKRTSRMSHPITRPTGTATWLDRPGGRNSPF